MRNFQVYPTAFVVVICLFMIVTEVNGLKYSVEGLRSAVNYQCCVRYKKEYENYLETGEGGINKRGIQKQMLLKKASEAKVFLLHLTTRTLLVECCFESCSNEEIYEGSGLTAVELGEECLQEGCFIEEIYEHC